MIRVFAPVQLQPEDSVYPGGLRRFLGGKSLPHLSAIGNLDLLQETAIALFCSADCPADLARQTYAIVKKLRDAQFPVISGFHSPIEKECLKLLMQGTQPLIHCPARSLQTLRLSPDQKTTIEAKRLLLLSPFPASQKRATAVLAERRNRLVSAIATSVFIAYATPGGKTEKLAQAIADHPKPLFTFNSPDTQNLQQIGAEVVGAKVELSVLVAGREVE